MIQLSLPEANNRTAAYTLKGSPLPAVRMGRNLTFNRVAFSAAHVVADPLSAADPTGAAAIDWGATVAYRRHLLGLGLGIAESMDTAQRGMGLDWLGALELVKRTLAETSDIPGALIFSGCGTDQLHAGDAGRDPPCIRSRHAHPTSRRHGAPGLTAAARLQRAA